jgi:hypothetical protein
MAHWFYSLAYGLPFVLLVAGSTYIGAKVAGDVVRGSIIGGAVVVAVLLFGKAVEHYNSVDGDNVTYTHTISALKFSCLGVVLGFGLLWSTRREISQLEQKYGTIGTWFTTFCGVVGATLIATAITLFSIGAPVLQDEIFNAFLVWLLVGIAACYVKSEVKKPSA